MAILWIHIGYVRKCWHKTSFHLRVPTSLPTSFSSSLTSFIQLLQSVTVFLFTNYWCLPFALRPLRFALFRLSIIHINDPAVAVPRWWDARAWDLLHSTPKITFKVLFAHQTALCMQGMPNWAKILAGHIWNRTIQYQEWQFFILPLHTALDS